MQAQNISDGRRILGDSIYVFKAVNLLDIEKYEASDINKLNLSEHVTTYSVNESVPCLPRGHYWLIAKKDDGGIISSVYTVDEFNYSVLRDTNDPEFFFYDNKGKPLENLSVDYQNKTYKVDPSTHTIRLTNTPKGASSMLVDKKGVKYRLDLNNKGRAYDDIPTPEGFLKSKDSYISHSYKTEYKCGDTVNVDSDKNIADSDYIYFYNQWYDLLYKTVLKKDKKSDSYKEIYLKNIILSEECAHLKEGRIIVTVADENDKYNRELELAQFDYIERKYKLTSNISSQKHLRDMPPTLTIRVTEQDDDYSPDDYIVVLAYTEDVLQSYNDSLFVPAILLKDTIPLIINTDIRYVLPDSIFPSADIKYKLGITLNRNDKFDQTNTIYNIESSGLEEMLSVSEQGYKLNIRKFNNKESLSADGVLEVFSKNGYLYEQKITLPYSAVINPVAVAYRVTSGNLTDSITIRNKKICPVEYIHNLTEMIL